MIARGKNKTCSGSNKDDILRGEMLRAVREPPRLLSTQLVALDSGHRTGPRAIVQLPGHESGVCKSHFFHMKSFCPITKGSRLFVLLSHVIISPK